MCAKLTCCTIVLVFFKFKVVFPNNVSDFAKTDQIWGPLLEEWALDSHRNERVLHFSPENVYSMSYRNSTSKEKIVSNRPVNNRVISDTDIYLLNAMEKLVHRMDFMEKRVKRLEEMLFYVMAGNRIDLGACPNNFTRIDKNCYLFVPNSKYDWKAASKYCKKLGGFLAEFETKEENQNLVNYIESNKYLKGKHYWIGGLNPGLLWIWSNSARPINVVDVENEGILGDGRCLRLFHDPTLKNYFYHGIECSAHFNFICEILEDTSNRELGRIGKNIIHE